MEVNLDYTQLIYKNMIISFIGDKDSVKDMQNYLSYHAPNGSITMSAISNRLQIHDIYVHVRKFTQKAKIFPFIQIKRLFRNQTGKLLSDTDYVSVMAYFKEEMIATPYGVPHHLIVKYLISSMWKRFITKLEESDLDPENPDPSTTLLFQELATKE